MEAIWKSVALSRMRGKEKNRGEQVSEQKHTPGPWRVVAISSSYFDIGGNPEDARNVPTGKKGEIAYDLVCRVCRTVDVEANAELIARAPDLLAKLTAANERVAELERLQWNEDIQDILTTTGGWRLGCV